MLLYAGQRPEGDPSDGMVLLLGDETPLRAHRAGSEHAFQVLVDFFTVVWGAGGLDEEVVEFFGTDGTGAHIYGVLPQQRGDKVGARPWLV